MPGGLACGPGAPVPPWGWCARGLGLTLGWAWGSAFGVRFELFGLGVGLPVRFCFKLYAFGFELFGSAFFAASALVAVSADYAGIA